MEPYQHSEIKRHLLYKRGCRELKSSFLCAEGTSQYLNFPYGRGFAHNESFIVRASAQEPFLEFKRMDILKVVFRILASTAHCTAEVAFSCLIITFEGI